MKAPEGYAQEGREMAGTKYGVLVGVTRMHEYRQALAWACDEAVRREAPLTVVHVATAALPSMPTAIVVGGEPIMTVGREILDAVMDELEQVNGGRVTALPLLEYGNPACMLVDLSKDAELVVLSHRQHDGAKRIRTFSHTTSVAAHAQRPVVVVPEGPRESPEPRTGWVTVGVHENGTPQPVVEAAFAAAEARGAPLRLVHGWRADPAYDDIISRRIDPDWAQRVGDGMVHAVEALAAQHPSVEVEPLVLHEWPAEALAECAATSRLLVVGRHGRPPVLPHRIGSIAREALRTTACPVTVVPV